MTASAIDIPYDSLPPATLHAVVEELVTRDGTDYGASEASLDDKIADVMRQLRRGEARIVFDPESNSVNIVVAARAGGRDRNAREP